MVFKSFVNVALINSGYLDESPICDNCGGSGYVGTTMCECLRELCRQRSMVAVDFEGRRYDTGNLKGFLEATIDFALEHPETGDWLNHFIRDKADLLKKGR